MLSMHKMTGIISCTFLLSLGISTAVRADNLPVNADKLTAEQSDRSQGETTQNDQSQNGKVIKGEVLRVEGDNWFIKDENGKEVQFSIDQTTRGYEGEDMKGVHIEAMVDDQNHAELISSPDRRNDHESSK